MSASKTSGHKTKSGGPKGPQTPKKPGRKFDRELDEALEESFPASDPASPVQPPHSKEDKDGV